MIVFDCKDSFFLPKKAIFWMFFNDLFAGLEERLYFCTQINMNHKLYKPLTIVCLSAAVWLINPCSASAYSTEEEKVLEMFHQFRELYEKGSEEEFYELANDYEEYLLDNDRLVDYYKIKCNEGFYDVRHRHIYKAMKTAKELDEVVRRNGDTAYYYLATGLFGDVYRVSYDSPKAKKYYLQALKEVGDRDPKFTMTTYLNMADLLNIQDPNKALEYAEKSISLAKKVDNMEFLSLSIAYKAFVLFLSKDDGKDFNLLYERYDYLKNRNHPDFNHRYDGIMDAAKAAYDQDYDKALAIIRNRGGIPDSALSVVRVYALAGDMKNCFGAMRRMYVDLDSVFSITQSANFDELSVERQLVLSQEEVALNRKLVQRMSIWLVVGFVLFILIYIMGRHRLMQKIRKLEGKLLIRR